jgi:predicted NAD/FAD-binding protein
MAFSGGGGEGQRLRVAVVGSGISGLSAAWLLSKRHDVTLYEKDDRVGGHANTVDVVSSGHRTPVDTGFIVFNPKNYPNLTALFAHLGVETAASEMSFSVSLDEGKFEYGGATVGSLFAQKSNLVSPRYWSMLRDLARFYRTAPGALKGCSAELTLGEFLDVADYGDAFVNDHLLPMAGSIWSAAPDVLKGYPAAAFVQFFQNHGLLELSNRPQWRTVAGGSARYVSKLLADSNLTLRTDAPVRAVTRLERGIVVETDRDTDRYDRILIAAHADDGLALLTDPSESERRVLSAFTYTRNLAVLHADPLLMPKRRGVWSSWNYAGRRGAQPSRIQVTYWMNRLQPLATDRNLFVTLNPHREPDPEKVLRTETYTHPVFTAEALRAQAELQSLQGARGTWYCGAYFGSGFHEDGLRSGLAAAEDMGGARRPWAKAIEAAPLSRNHAGAV